MVSKGRKKSMQGNPITGSIETLHDICAFLHKVHRKANKAHLRHGQDMIKWAAKMGIRRPDQLSGAKVTLNKHPKIRKGKSVELMFDDLKRSAKVPGYPKNEGVHEPYTKLEGYWVLCAAIEIQHGTTPLPPWGRFEVCVACPTMIRINTPWGLIEISLDPRCKFIITGFSEGYT